MRESLRIAVAGTCALAAAGVTYLLQANQDLLFLHDWTQPVGTFSSAEDPTARKAALAFMAQRTPGKTCVDQWVGRDQRYVYVSVGCGTFRAEGPRIEVDGDPTFLPTRVRFEAGEPKEAEWVDTRNFENSLRRLYPRVAADLVRVRMNPDLYRKQGLAKATAPAAAPAPAPGQGH